VKALLQEYDQAITVHLDLEGFDRAGRRSVDLFTVIGVGGLAYAAALDRSCADYWVKPAMAYMRASVVKGMKFSVIATDYQHAHGQSAAFQSQCSARLLQLNCAVQVDRDLSAAETPALRIDRFGSRRQAENALKEIAIEKFDGHEASKEYLFKSGYFGKGLNQTNLKLQTTSAIGVSGSLEHVGPKEATIDPGHYQGLGADPQTYLPSGSPIERHQRRAGRYCLNHDAA
jgi:hypothetical protein